MPHAPTKASTYYEIDGQGPDVTLIHGVGNWCGDWGPVIEQFRGRFRVLRYDLRGHARSAILPGPYAIDDFVDDLRDLLDHLEIARTHLVGFSLGGLIAQGFALAHADRLNRLAILASVAGRTDEEKARVRARLDFIRSSPPDRYFDQSVERWFTPAFRASSPERIAAKKKVISSMDPDAYFAAYTVLCETDFADRLHQISAPTLVMSGENDVGSNPRMARLMHERLPNGQLIILPNLRHNLVPEAPEIVGGILREFFSAA
jgi:pimeloyl-ACP methyl ester carboxylesterase